jgi:hypothetical protein
MATKRVVEKWESSVWTGEMFSSKKECEIFDLISNMNLNLNILVTRCITRTIIDNEDKFMKIMNILMEEKISKKSS